MAGRIYNRILGKDFSVDPANENFSGLTFNPRTRTYFMCDNVSDMIFEIDRDGSPLRAIDATNVRNPIETRADIEGMTYLYDDYYALVMEASEEMAIVRITANTTSITRAEAVIFDLSGDPKGVAYRPSESAVYWVSQENPMRVVKCFVDIDNRKLSVVWNRTLDNMPDTGLADVAFFPRLSPNLFLLGQSSSTIVEVDTSGSGLVIKSTYSFANWPIPRPGAMAFDPDDGSLRIVGKHAAGVPQDDFTVFMPTSAFMNRAPIANAGAPVVDVIDGDLSGDELVLINAAASIDPDGVITNYKWHVNGVLVQEGFRHVIPVFAHTFAFGTSLVTFSVTDDALSTTQINLQVVVSTTEPNQPFHQSPNDPAVSQNYVHPGSEQRVEIAFQVKGDGTGHITIYDQLGRQVKRIDLPDFPPGAYRAPWDLRNEEGSVVSSGVYFVQINAPGFKKRDKLVVIR